MRRPMGDGAVPTSGAMQRFGHYPEYRESGVEWLGEIPAHWEVSRLKVTLLSICAVRC